MVEISADVALTAITSVVSLFLLIAVGVTGSQWPAPTETSERGLLSITVVRKLAGFYILVIEPCLSITSIGSRMTLETFKGVWPMMLWGAINPLLGFILTYLTMLLAKPPKKLRRVYLANGMFANILGVPLVLIETLCTQKTLENEADCFERATSFAFIHKIGFGMVFWTVGYSLLMGSDVDADTSSNSKRFSIFKFIWKILTLMVNAPFVAMIIGFTIAMSGSKSFFFGPDAPLLFLTSPMKTVANGAVLVLTLLMAAGVGQNLRRQGFFDWVHRNFERVSSGVRRSNKVSIAIPEVVVCESKEDKPDTCESKEDESNNRHPHKYPHEAPPLIFDDSADDVRSILHYDNEDDKSSVNLTVEDEDDLTIPHRVVIWMVFTRLIVVTAAEFCVVTFVGTKLFTGPDAALAQLMLTLQSITPSNNLCILLCQKAGRWDSVHAFAQSILLQYILGMLTLTIYTALALSVYE